MALPTASMREYAFGLVKASFHRPLHFLSALSQAIPPYFERNTEPLPSLPSEEGLTNSSLITSFDLIMNVELGFYRHEVPWFISEKVSAVRLVIEKC